VLTVERLGKTSSWQYPGNPDHKDSLALLMASGVKQLRQREEKLKQQPDNNLTTKTRVLTVAEI
jgi:hypothetical protein